MINAIANISADAFDAASINQCFASPTAHLIRFRIKTPSRRNENQLSLRFSGPHIVGNPAVRSSKALSVGRKLHHRPAPKRTSAEQEDKQVSGGERIRRVRNVRATYLHAIFIRSHEIRWPSDLVHRESGRRCIDVFFCLQDKGGVGLYEPESKSTSSNGADPSNLKAGAELD